MNNISQEVMDTIEYAEISDIVSTIAQSGAYEHNIGDLLYVLAQNAVMLAKRFEKQVNIIVVNEIEEMLDGIYGKPVEEQQRRFDKIEAELNWQKVIRNTQI